MIDFYSISNYWILIEKGKYISYLKILKITALIVITLRECENARFHYFGISTICKFDKTIYVSLILILKRIYRAKSLNI